MLPSHNLFQALEYPFRKLIDLVYTCVDLKETKRKRNMTKFDFQL